MSIAVEVVFNPIAGPENKLPERLRQFIALNDVFTNHESLYCSDVCAIDAIGKNQHRKKAHLVVPANEAEAKQTAKIAGQINALKRSN